MVKKIDISKILARYVGEYQGNVHIERVGDKVYLVMAEKKKVKKDWGKKTNHSWEF